LYVIILLSYHR